MCDDLDSLNEFPKDPEGLYIVYDRFTFDDLFRLLLKNGLDDEEGLSFILGNCSLSALVFQERIYNEAYQDISEDEALSPDLAAYRGELIYEFLEDLLGPLPSTK
jgi:hypothetical protein